MEKDKQIKGILYGIISLLLVSLEPIVAKSRPEVIDSYLYAATTCLIEALIFAPLWILERRRIKQVLHANPFEKDFLNLHLNNWKKRKNFIFMVYIGINFAVAQVLFFLALQFGGAINISLAQQTTIIFALFFGFLINREKISSIQVIFSIMLIFGLTLAITQGSFNVLEFNLGVFIMLITAILWTSAHAQTKNIFQKEQSTPTQFIFFRNALSGFFLIASYFLFFPFENIFLFFDPINQFYFIAMGLLYGFDVFFWYKSLECLEFSKAAVIVSPMPLLTALFATIFLGEIFTIFHFFGAMIIIISIIIIVKLKKG